MRFFRVAVVVTSLVSLQLAGCGNKKVVDQPAESAISEEDLTDMAEKMKAMAPGGASPAPGGASPAPGGDAPSGDAPN